MVKASTSGVADLGLIPTCVVDRFPGPVIPESLLLLRCRKLDGDACCPHESGCPPQLLQVAIQLVPQ